MILEEKDIIEYLNGCDVSNIVDIVRGSINNWADQVRVGTEILKNVPKDEREFWEEQYSNTSKEKEIEQNS